MRLKNTSLIHVKGVFYKQSLMLALVQWLVCWRNKAWCVLLRRKKAWSSFFFSGEPNRVLIQPCYQELNLLTGKKKKTPRTTWWRSCNKTALTIPTGQRRKRKTRSKRCLANERRMGSRKLSQNNLMHLLINKLAQKAYEVEWITVFINCFSSEDRFMPLSARVFNIS